MDRLLSAKALGAMLDLAEQTIYNRHSLGGDLPPAVKLGRTLRFRLSDVETWIASKLSSSKPPRCPATAAPAPDVFPHRPRGGRPTKAEQIAKRRLAHHAESVGRDR